MSFVIASLIPECPVGFCYKLPSSDSRYFCSKMPSTCEINSKLSSVDYRVEQACICVDGMIAGQQQLAWHGII